MNPTVEKILSLPWVGIPLAVVFCVIVLWIVCSAFEEVTGHGATHQDPPPWRRKRDKSASQSDGDPS
jgi:hypothetical protein